MIINRERLSGALTPERYIETMASNRELFEANLAAARVTDEERAFFAGLAQPLDVLVLTEDWCGDSAANLPMVVRLARETGKLRLHILRREGNEDISDNYQLADGRNHIPTYIVLDADRNELGHVIERPEAITAKLSGFKGSWFAAHPDAGPEPATIAEMAQEVRDRYFPDQRAYRDQFRDLEAREIFALFRAIAERAPALSR